MEETYLNNEPEGVENAPSNEEKPKKKLGLGIASLVLGILSLICCWFWGIGIIFGIIAFVLGLVAAIKGCQSGRGLGVAGLILGFVGIVLGTYFLVQLFSMVDFDKLRIAINNLPKDTTDRQKVLDWMRTFIKPEYQSSMPMY